MNGRGFSLMKVDERGDEQEALMASMSARWVAVTVRFDEGDLDR